jgi:hypothetical protein
MQATENRRLQRQQHVTRLCGFGDRCVFELIDEIAREYGILDDVDRRLAKYATRYAEFSPLLIAVLGADKFPNPPIHAVSSADAEGGR